MKFQPAGEAEKDYWKKLRQGQGLKREYGGGRGHQNNRGSYNDNRGRGRYVNHPSDASFRICLVSITVCGDL